MNPPPLPGDLVAWRRMSHGEQVAAGDGLVLELDGLMVVVRPITGSTSHRLRRPARDVVRLVSHRDLVMSLHDEFNRLAPW